MRTNYLLNSYEAELSAFHYLVNLSNTPLPTEYPSRAPSACCGSNCKAAAWLSGPADCLSLSPHPILSGLTQQGQAGRSSKASPLHISVCPRGTRLPGK